MSSQPGDAAAAPAVATNLLYPKSSAFARTFSLWYFAALMTFWNIIGRAYLGFEQSWAQMFAGIGTAIFMQFLLEWVDAKANDRRPRYLGSRMNFLNFFPPALIAGFACSMLLFPNESIWPICFASALAIGSKVIFRAPLAKGVTQHMFNPSNLGIMTTLAILPWVGIAPPYHFINRVDDGSGFWNLAVPIVILVSGIYLHGRYTGRLPLVLAWVLGFALQGFVRSQYFHAPFHIFLVPMTGSAFVIFTLYMIPDPATTPVEWKRQILFGASTAACYGVLFVFHVVFGLLLSLVIVCGVRMAFLHIVDFRRRLSEASEVPQATGAPVSA